MLKSPISGPVCLGLLIAFTFFPLQARELDHIRGEIDHLIEDRIRSIVEGRAEAGIADQIAAQVENTVETRVGVEVEAQVESDVEPLIEYAYEPAPEELEAPVVAEPETRERLHPVDPEPVLELDIIDRVLERQIEAIEDELDLALSLVIDDEGHSALKEEWLVLSDAASLAALQTEGYTISVVEELKGLGYVLGIISAPETFDPMTTSLAAIQILNSPTVAVDLNHVYMPQRDSSAQSAPNGMTSSVTTRLNPVWPRIGMIDSTIDLSHPVFSDAAVSEVLFTPRKFHNATQHGTAIASILVGRSTEYTGFSPGTHLFNGAVFVHDKNGVEFSTVTAIVRAINWLIEQQVPLINMSLAGPDNIILERVVSSACDKGVTFVTAVGNAGPGAAPLFPAAYNCTIAVTATDSEGTPYHRANRGSHVDFAVPGTNILHAANAASYRRSSGTSYAAAILSGKIAMSYPFDEISSDFVRKNLAKQAEDLGASGRDAVYGYGLLRPQPTAYTLK